MATVLTSACDDEMIEICLQSESSLKQLSDVRNKLHQNLEGVTIMITKTLNSARRLNH